MKAAVERAEPELQGLQSRGLWAALLLLGVSHPAAFRRAELHESDFNPSFGEPQSSSQPKRQVGVPQEQRQLNLSNRV